MQYFTASARQPADTTGKGAKVIVELLSDGGGFMLETILRSSPTTSMHNNNYNWFPDATIFYRTNNYSISSSNNNNNNDNEVVVENITDSINDQMTAADNDASLNNYWALFAVLLVVCTAAGNILVCLAIMWERRLQNVTNYFLMSLAITDLMVAILVMPLGILTLVKGECFFTFSTKQQLKFVCVCAPLHQKNKTTIYLVGRCGRY